MPPMIRRILNDVIGGEIAPGIDLHTAGAVDAADDLMWCRRRRGQGRCC